MTKEIVMSVVMTKAEREQFLAGLHVGILGVSAEHRGPILVPVWYLYEPGGEVSFITFERAKKVAMLKSEGRCTLCVQNEEPPYQYVSVEGPIRGIEQADVEQHSRPISRRYLGVVEGDAYVEETSGEPELLVRMKPERWSTADYGKGTD
jgi:nitroimidazol reductase NimA-like FMN-containing flavoprotein (pyridoxamine 5'-phosphate oxidase superfamily)